MGTKPQNTLRKTLSPALWGEEGRAFCGKKAKNDLNCRFEPWVVGLQERFFRCQNKEYIQIIRKSGCSARAVPPLRRVLRTRGISTWKFAPLATRSLPASRSWSILPAGLSGSAVSTPSRMRVSPTRPRLPQPGRRAGLRKRPPRAEASFAWGCDEKSVHEEEL